MKKKIVQFQDVKLSEEVTQKCIDFLKSNPQEIYWDYRDELTLEQINKAMNEEDGWLNLENEIWENSLDYICDLEYQLIEEMKKEIPEIEDIETSDIREEFMDYITVDFNIKQLIRNTSDVRVRVVVHSNFEGCGWADREGDQEYKRSDYVKQIRKLLRSKYDKESFQKELNNICSSVNQFIFYFKASIEDLMEIKQDWQSITIPKEAWAGFYDGWNGSGSLLGVKLLKDITLKRQYGETEHDEISIVIDQAKKYSVEETYGFCNVPDVKIKTK